MEFYEERIKPFEGVSYYSNPTGYIAWRKGTGDNVELLHLRVHHPRQGHATFLMRHMVRKLLQNPPYHSVFVFVRADNYPALCAYDSWGFNLNRIQGLYQKGGTVIGTISFDNLRTKLGV